MAEMLELYCKIYNQLSERQLKQTIFWYTCTTIHWFYAIRIRNYSLIPLLTNAFDLIEISFPSPDVMYLLGSISILLAVLVDIKELRQETIDWMV